MTREVYCNLNNKANGPLTWLSTNLNGGEYTKGGVKPPGQIATSANGEIFYFHKKTGLHLTGVQGTVQYTMQDQSILTLSFNNPYTQTSGGESFNGCYFYALFSNTGGQTGYYADVQVQIGSSKGSGNSMALNPMINGNVVTANVTITQA